MKPVALGRIDPSILVSIAAAGVLFTAAGSARAFSRAALTLAEIAWRYLANARG